MRLAQDERFRIDRAERALRFTCEDCAIFDPGEQVCAHGYPTSEHRLARYEDRDAALVFCKEWDLA